ncbi:Hypothetical predicted protein [Paramuricea clavata]|uniref:Uncharacterized protein n=1 Tax=Paramuricea clavata TaxID=317549 RepID=A0A7D9DE52_PARCT|nr:Hypothetical predicted protein [Paramuricea clavata]
MDELLDDRYGEGEILDRECPVCGYSKKYNSACTTGKKVVWQCTVKKTVINATPVDTQKIAEKLPNSLGSFLKKMIFASFLSGTLPSLNSKIADKNA